MSEHDETNHVAPLPAVVLEAYAVDPPPPRFAEDVVDAAGTTPEGGVRRRTVPFIVGALAVAATVALLFFVSARPGGGAVRATARRSLALSQRAAAVMEPGSSLSWSADGAGIAVVQAEGSVFYRVESGARFEIDTPVGRASALGTCFAVDVLNMTNDKGNKKKIGAGLAAATAAALVVVTVYEGTVRLASDDGVAEAGPGQQLMARPGEPPQVRASSRAAESTEALANALSTARRQAKSQRARIRDLERELASASSRHEGAAAPASETPVQRAQRCLTWGGVDCSFVDPEPEVLLELARCGLVWADGPADAEGAPEAWASLVDAADLTDEEAVSLAALGKRFAERHDATLRALYLDLGGSPALAEQLPTEAVEGAIWSLVPDESSGAVVRRVARERAGLEEVPEQVDDPAEAYTRYNLDLGQAYEDHVATQLGRDRAHDIRLALDGWPGGKSTYGDGKCE